MLPGDLILLETGAVWALFSADGDDRPFIDLKGIVKQPEPAIFIREYFTDGHGEVEALFRGSVFVVWNKSRTFKVLSSLA